MTTCAYCQIDPPIANSHVVPAFIVRHIKDNNPEKFILNSWEFRKLQDGSKGVGSLRSAIMRASDSHFIPEPTFVAMPDTVHAVFVDIMGFAEALLALEKREHVLLGMMVKGDFWAGKSPTERHLVKIASRYFTFHEYLHEQGYALQDYIDTVIEFSDSAYIVFKDEHLIAAEKFSAAMMRRFMRKKLPVRIGIGTGGFTRMRFSTLTEPNGLSRLSWSASVCRPKDPH